MSKRLVAALAICFAGTNPYAWASPEDLTCRAFPHGRSSTNTDIDAAIGERLRGLPAPQIPPNQFRRVMQKMRRDLQPVRRVAADILANERDYIAGQTSRNEVVEKSQATREALGTFAQKILAKPALDVSDRRQLEAIRLLRDRTRRVETQSPEELAKIVSPADEDAQEPDRPPARADQTGAQKESENSAEGQEDRTAGENQSEPQDPPDNSSPRNSKETQQSSERQKHSQSGKERAPAERESRKNADRQNSDHVESRSNETNQRMKDEAHVPPEPSREDHDQESGDGQKPQSKPNTGKEEKPPSGEQKQKSNEKSDLSKKPNTGNNPKQDQHKDSDSSPETKGDSSPAEDKESGEGKSSPGQGSEESGETGSQGGSPSPNAQPNGKESGEAGKGSDSASGKSSSSSKSEQKGPAGQSSDSQSGSKGDGESQSDPSGAPANGASKGGGPDQQPLMDRLQDFFKNLLSEQVSKDDKPAPGKNSQIERSTPDPAEVTKRWDEIQRRKQTPTLKEKQERTPLSGSKKRNADEKRSPLGQLEDARQTELLLKLIQRLSAQALRNYRSSGAFATGLGELQTTLASISAEIPRSDALRQAVSELRSVREGLETYQVEYKTLEHLGLSLLRTIEGSSTDSLRKLNFLNDLLSVLEKRTPLSYDEQRSLDLIRRLLQLANSDEQPSDKDFAEAFVSQLMGPLSRKMIKDRFRSEAMPGGYDFAAMAAAFRNGEYNDLLIQSALKPYMNLLLNTSMKPKDRTDPNGPTAVISEHEPTLEQAQDLSNFQAFYRDGSPTDVDLLKYLSGDMLEWIYRDEVKKPDPKTLYPKKVTYILYDISTSMLENNKFTLATALILAYLDRSQVEVRTGKAEHIVYTEAFNQLPHEPERIGSLAQAQTVFERIRGTPLKSEGSTEITGAIVDVYNRIQVHQAEGGELERANIFLITDAEDTIRFQEIEDARRKIHPDLKIRMNVVTLGELKGDIQKLAEFSGGEGEGKLGDVGQRHIDYAQITDLLNQQLRVNIIQKSVAAFRRGDKQQIANAALIDLKNKLVLLESNRDSTDTSKLTLYSRLDRLLQTQGPAAEDPALTMPIRHFQRLASSRTATGWTRAERLENLWGYLGDLAQAIGSDAETVVDSLSEAQRAGLRTWLR